MKAEVIYHLFTQFGTCVQVSLEDFLDTLKQVRSGHYPYHIEVDKQFSHTWFVTLFNWI